MPPFGAVFVLSSKNKIAVFDTSGLDGQFEDISDFNNKSLLYCMGNCATIIARDFKRVCNKLKSACKGTQRTSYQGNRIMPNLSIRMNRSKNRKYVVSL